MSNNENNDLNYLLLKTSSNRLKRVRLKAFWSHRSIISDSHKLLFLLFVIFVNSVLGKYTLNLNNTILFTSSPK